MSPFSRPSIEQPKFIGDLQQVRAFFSICCVGSSFEVYRLVLTHTLQCCRCGCDVPTGFSFNLCPYCGDTLPSEHGAKMRFAKKKTQLMPGAMQVDTTDNANVAASDATSAHASLTASASDAATQPPVPPPNPSHKKKKVTTGTTSIGDKKAKVDSLLSISSTASFAFDERKMWQVDPNDLTALKKHAGKTDHCNICGHSGCDAICGSCGSQFHTACVTNDRVTWYVQMSNV